MSTTIAAVEAEVAERIAGLVVAGRSYEQKATDAFRRSRIPLTATRDAALRKHLAFSVSIESAPTGAGEFHAGGYASVKGARLAVVYCVRIPPAPSDADAGANAMASAADAAQDIAGILLAESVLYGIWPLDLYRPGPLEGEFIAVRMDFLVDFELSLSPSYPGT